MKNWQIASASLSIFASQTLGKITCESNTCDSVFGDEVAPGSAKIYTREELTNITSSDETSTMLRVGIKIKIPVINHYGCWCYGGEHWPGARDLFGSGPVQDDWDQICKSHHMGFDCISMDATEKNLACDPTQQDYKMLVTASLTGDFYTLECHDDDITNWCAHSTCMVDLQFISANWELEESNVPKNYNAFGHPGGWNDNIGNFDTSICEVRNPRGNGGNGGGSNSRQKTCCGDYPYRIWYQPRNWNSMKCCEISDQHVDQKMGFPVKVGVMYNSQHSTCCETGVVHGSTIC